MRVSIVLPSITDFYFTPHRMTGLGARTVEKLCKGLGHTTTLLDFPGSRRKPRGLEIPDELGYLKPYVLDETGPASFFTGFKRLGPPIEECAAIVAETTPDLVLMSCFAYAYAGDAIELAQAIKKRLPTVPIAAGGAGPSVLPGKYLAREVPGIDYVLAGEAEVNLAEFLSETQKKTPDFSSVPNLHHQGRNDNPLQYTRPGDLEWVAHTREKPDGRCGVTTSLTRGCPRRCSFCSNHLCHGRTFRKISLERYTAGLEDLKDYRSVHINFEDDNLFADVDYGKSAMEIARSKFPGIRFTAENGVDAGFMDEPLLDFLVASGFSSFNLSLASISPRVLARESRRPVHKKISVLVERAARLGAPTTTYFICGLPGDTPETVAANLLFLHSLPTTIGISLFYPVPGLKGFTDPEVFLNTQPRLACGSSAFPWTGSLTTSQLVTSFRLARFLNLLKDGKNRELHSDLIQAVLSSKRLFTWDTDRRTLLKVPGMDAGICDAVLQSIDC